MIGSDGWSEPTPTEQPKDPRDEQLATLLHQGRDAAGDPTAALGLAALAADVLPLPGSGETARLWSGLAELAAIDLTLARSLEPHLDAVAILAQARAEGYDVPAADGTWGVFAAEGPGARLTAEPDESEKSPAEAGATVRLTGRKPWCSLADRLDHALITAWVDDGSRGLFAVDLHHPGVTQTDEPWVSRGLPDVRSSAIELQDVPAIAVGPAGWYLKRPGFAWGGLGVAACWYGGAVGLARTLRDAAGRREPDQIGLSLLGRVDARLTAAGAVLAQAARAVDGGLADGPFAWEQTVRTRDVVHDACDDVITTTLHALGPAPLTSQERYAAAIADLQVYLRQHKAQRDAAVVGSAVTRGMPTAW